ncbi:hypothetical protein [Thalassotalea marina]|uniref:Uncharacterized protein n=1 Tax=Thalassotalea marina TaxID=1673741 RepID=A0A919EG48_9GAMM|nr:hypothetical protein [Thalassotalea marina]GHF78811.1 hypothetical protein GCM10017161_02380 [Thalassotalea marina]
MSTMPRYVKLNNWIFEVKAVRALRVEDYGDPYSAIASVSVNGDTAYFDGLLTRENEVFTRADFETFKQFCSQLEVGRANFDRFKNQIMFKESVDIEKLADVNILQLVK